MAYWSAENATKAYLKTISTNKERRSKEPDIAEYISALAAGNNAQLMMLTFATNDASSITTLLALIAASQQTGGRVICILPTLQQLDFSELQALCHNDNNVEFVTGDPQSSISCDHYRNADFVLVDCNLDNQEEIIKKMQKMSSRIVVGYNAFCKGSSWEWSGLKTHLLPIGAGLLVTTINEKKCIINTTSKSHCGTIKKSLWVVKVDECTGEEHVFRVRYRPQENIKIIA